jgi:rSAM/selenodomain-associated transferase 2
MHGASAQAMARVSVIMPTLNAAATLEPVLAALVPGLVAGVLGDLVVVDGGSADATRDLAADMGARVITAPRGRASQLQAGVAGARHDWLLLLHADTVLGKGWEQAVGAHLPVGEEQAGFFLLAFDDASPQARRVARLANWRARTFGLPYGDQGLLIHKRLLASVGGIADLPLMEDLDLAARLGRRRLVMLDATATTSAERYRRGGWWAVPARNLVLAGAFLAGVSAARLKGLYR